MKWGSNDRDDRSLAHCATFPRGDEYPWQPRATISYSYHPKQWEKKAVRNPGHKRWCTWQHCCVPHTVKYFGIGFYLHDITNVCFCLASACVGVIKDTSWDGSCVSGLRYDWSVQSCCASSRKVPCTDSFCPSNRWMDKLGLAALLGHDIVIRQTFVRGHYALLGPTLEPMPVSIPYWEGTVRHRPLFEGLRCRNTQHCDTLTLEDELTMHNPATWKKRQACSWLCPWPLVGPTNPSKRECHSEHLRSNLCFVSACVLPHLNYLCCWV